jgi:hypothetical protein
VAAVLERGIGAQRAEEGLLEGVFGALAPELADEEGPDLVAVALVEPLEGGNAHPIGITHEPAAV